LGATYGLGQPGLLIPFSRAHRHSIRRNVSRGLGGEARERVSQAERDAAKAVETEKRTKVQSAARMAHEAKEQATPAFRRAEKAEATVRQAEVLPVPHGPSGALAGR
jgi:hypothetical protein